jgi:two-component system, OmpR family, copper resistance phosphate regulon response regulator CusR
VEPSELPRIVCVCRSDLFLHLQSATKQINCELVEVSQVEFTRTRLPLEGVSLVALDFSFIGKFIGQTIAATKKYYPDTYLIGLADWSDMRFADVPSMKAVDDLIFIPAHAAELQFRLSKHLENRKEGFDTHALVFDFGFLRFDLQRLDVSARNKALGLTKREFEIFLFLARNPSRFVDKKELAQVIWKQASADVSLENVISVHIARLRKKISDAGCEPVIETQRGMGLCMRPEAVQ